MLDRNKVIPHEANQQAAADREYLSTFANVDFQRARFWCLSAALSAKVPKRLGADATRAQLAADRRTGRKICNMYRELWKMGHIQSGFPEPPSWNNWPVITNDPMMARIASTVVWKRQVDYLINVVWNRMISLTEHEEFVLAVGLKAWYVRHSKVLDWEHEALYKIKDAILVEEQSIIEKRTALDEHNAEAKRASARAALAEARAARHASAPPS